MWFLGVDCGGSQIKGLLADRTGQTLRTSVGGPGNIAVLGKSSFQRNITEVVEQLFSGTPAENVVWATFGVAGAGRAFERQQAQDIIVKFGIQNFSLLTDWELLYGSFFGDGVGILLGSGTGSYCIYKSKAHEFVQLGGWGYLLGDEGSGFAIGRSAVRQVLTEAEETRQLSEFSQDLLAFFAAEQPSDLISKIYASKNPQHLVASCSETVCTLAETDNAQAVAIVDDAIDALVRYVKAASERLAGSAPNKLALTGGVLSSSSVRKKLVRRIEESGLRVESVEQEIKPVCAAVLHALSQAGEQPTAELLRRLQSPDL